MRILPLLVSCSALVAGCGGFAPESHANTEPAPQTEPVTVNASLRVSDDLTGLPDIAESAVQSVVNIATRKVTTLPQMPQLHDPFFRYFQAPQGQQAPQERVERSLGSGVIVAQDGVILTNNHVIQGAEEIQVTLSDGRSFDAELVGTDPKTDVAVVRLVDPPDDLRLLPLGDSDALRLGEVVLAVGNPFGVGQTVTMGIVSAKGRAEVGIVDYEDFIQTDAAINPGNSGGALVNLRGELVGINTAILSRSGGYQGVGFAIPTGMARGVMDALMADGRVDRGWLGVEIQDVDADLVAALELPEGSDGVLVAGVVDDSPAEAIGLERGDVIVSLNDHPVDSVSHLRNAVAAAGADAEVSMEVIRDGDRKTLTGALGLLEDDRAAAVTATDSADEPERAGLRLQALDEPLARRLGVEGEIDEGVVVVGVTPDSPAARAGLRAGDIIVEVNRRPVDHPKEFGEAWAEADARLLLLVRRGEGTLFVALPKP
ncbi:MAG: Do family serine endopeptidase [Alphaproteobacteria bacterium]|nr:Do family serine endopeptidase [Alphaproteobacteria bacterium]